MKIEISPKEKTEILNIIENHGVARKKAQGSRFDEVDFLCGAMAVFDAMGILNQITPLRWILNPMVTGEEILVEKDIAHREVEDLLNKMEVEG